MTVFVSDLAVTEMAHSSKSIDFFFLFGSVLSFPTMSIFGVGKGLIADTVDPQAMDMASRAKSQN